MERAKIFHWGRSQVVRLSKGFRIDADEVHVRRVGRSIVLEPVARGWAWLDDLPDPIDSDFAESAMERVVGLDRQDIAILK